MAVIGKKGQISIEFILIVTIALIYINASVWPTIGASSQSATEIKAVADAKIAAMKLANALNEAVVSNGDMRKTIGIYLPDGAEIACEAGSTEIEYRVPVLYLKNISGGNWNPDEVHCTQPLMDDAATPSQIGWTCSSTVKLLGDLQQSCGKDDVGAELKGPIFRKIAVEKEGALITFKAE